MLDLLTKYPFLDLIAYILLLSAFHWCVFRKPKICLLIAAVGLVKIVHTSGEWSINFSTSFNLLFFTSLWLCLYLSRNSPNYFWLFSGLVAIKVIDVCTYSWALQQGIWFFVWTIALDGLVLILINYRSFILHWFANSDSGRLSIPAKRSAPHQRLAYQEVILMLIYWISILISALAIGETLIRMHTDWFPTLIYYMYPYPKLFFSLFELIIFFNIACGHAVDFYSRKRVW